MPKYVISILNDEFFAANEDEYLNPAAAAEEAIKGALAVGAEQVIKGSLAARVEEAFVGSYFFGAEVSVSDGKSRERFVVAVGVTPLK